MEAPAAGRAEAGAGRGLAPEARPPPVEADWERVAVMATPLLAGESQHPYLRCLECAFS